MRNRIFLILIVILVLTAVSVCSSAAQDVDLSGMDNAQLMQLLQAIMQKLEEGSADKSPEAPVVTADPAAEDTPESAADADRFRIYENKKLVMERIPDWYFNRNDPTEDPPAEETPTDVPKDRDPCIICYSFDLADGTGLDCFSIC